MKATDDEMLALIEACHAAHDQAHLEGDECWDYRSWAFDNLERLAAFRRAAQVGFFSEALDNAL